LPLTSPLRFRNIVCRSRDGFLLRLETDSGTVGWGEAAPLPGFSRESLTETESALQQLTKSLHKLSVDPNQPLIEILHALPVSGKELPSTRFAAEQAIATLAVQSSRRQLRERLSETPNRSVPVNGLLAGTPEQMRERVAALLEAGYRTVKMKVGRGDLDKEVSLVREIRSLLPATIRLRLDANRAWSFDEAVRFCESIRDVDIDYIEEPVSDSSRLVALAAQTNIPVALDETLPALSAAELERFRGVSAVVLKPTMLGGITRTLAFVRAAEKIGARVVISSTFDTGLTVATLAELAAAVCDEQTACGLDTLHWLADDILSPRPVVECGCFPSVAFDDLVA
ncbi:MAG: o-succinylbenzoate synthase, partial [Candidatus Zixiibacteriota bacterium]